MIVPVPGRCLFLSLSAPDSKALRWATYRQASVVCLPGQHFHTTCPLKP